MQAHGHLRKMQVALDETVQYTLRLDALEIPLNALLGRSITLRYANTIHCIHCGRKTKKSFNQGYCYPCFTRLAQCDLCIVKPELCHFAAGTCREPDWAQQHCFQPHYVYLANSSGIKVGITRASQLPTRWIDQGASAAIPLFKVDSRRLSGLIEVRFKSHVADRTQWQRMLKGPAEPLDLKAKRDELLALTASELESLRNEFGNQSIESLVDADNVEINYPVLAYPSKVKSFNFEKTPEVSGILQGIKGQYLILDTGVINIRKFAGYEVTMTVA